VLLTSTSLLPQDAGFTTEVHHITGEGKDGGVVYCEMQGRENTGESRVNLELVREMYPGHCGYKSETGGIMSNLRDSTTNEKIRAYHKAFYRPENLCLIITGQVEAEDIFRALKPLEEKIMAKGDRGDFTRSWQSPVPPLTASLDKSVPYPCDNEDNGKMEDLLVDRTII
jgi:Predicted Zn-dependent peptidases, insulinase-like